MPSHSSEDHYEEDGQRPREKMPLTIAGGFDAHLCKAANSQAISTLIQLIMSRVTARRRRRFTGVTGTGYRIVEHRWELGDTDQKQILRR